MFRSLVVHEPPLFRILENEPQAQAALAAVQERIDAVIQMLAANDLAGGAQRFVETIAFGPGVWRQLPPELRPRDYLGARLIALVASDGAG